MLGYGKQPARLGSSSVSNFPLPLACMSSSGPNLPIFGHNGRMLKRTSVVLEMLAALLSKIVGSAMLLFPSATRMMFTYPMINQYIRRRGRHQTSDREGNITKQKVVYATKLQRVCRRIGCRKEKFLLLLVSEVFRTRTKTTGAIIPSTGLLTCASSRFPRAGTDL